MEPTKEQIKWFWEQCKFIWIDKPKDGLPCYCKMWLYPNGEYHRKLPVIDLNNLFKYAVPLIINGDNYTIQTNTRLGYTDVRVLNHYIEKHGVPMKNYTASDKDPALALFWAIYKALGGEE